MNPHWAVTLGAAWHPERFYYDPKTSEAGWSIREVKVL